MEKLLPQNIEAECGVLGSIIIDPEAIVQVADFLQAEDFYRDAHRNIYEVIMQLYEGHEAADFITICDELERRNKLEGVGGASYITSLIARSLPLPTKRPTRMSRWIKPNSSSSTSANGTRTRIFRSYATFCPII